MSSQNLEYIKKYFLSFDKKEQQSIYASLTDQQKNLLIEIGQAFHSTKGVSILANNILTGDYLRELEDIQIEYFIGLSELLAEGESNEIIENLLASKNPLFEQIVAEFKDEISFETDLLEGVSKIERVEVKTDLSIIDSAEEILDEELQKAIIQIERNELKNKLREIEIEIAKETVVKGKASRMDSINPNQLKNNTSIAHNENLTKYNLPASKFPVKRYLFYSIAACFSLCIIGISTYLLMDKQQVRYSKPADINPKTDIELFDTSMISGEKRIKIPLLKNYNQSYEDSLFVTIHNVLLKQEELKIFLSEETAGMVGEGPMAKKILHSIDSLKKIGNTYILSGRNLILNLENVPKEIQLLSLKEVNNKQVILKIENEFYLLSQNIIPNPLTPIADSKLINTIQSAYLSEIDKQ